MSRRRPTHRLRPARPFILGLTGSIGMGKSTAAEAFHRLGIPVLSSDAVVHRLLAAGGRGVAPVAAAFPKARIGNAIDRAAYGAVFDFIDVVITGWHFWTFNIADSAISVGVALLLFDGLFGAPRGSK